MTTAAFAGILAGLQATATRAAGAEDAFRASWRTELDRLETERKLAFRRMNLVADLARAIGGEPDRLGAAGAFNAWVAVEFALERGRPAHDEIFARLEPVAAAFAAVAVPQEVVAGGGEAEGEPGPAPDPVAALAAFEAWYAGRFGADFLFRADIAPPETPLVDW